MLWLLFLRETFWKRAKHVLRLDLNKNDPNKTKIVSEQKNVPNANGERKVFKQT